MDGGARGRCPGRAAHRARRRHVPDPPGPARLPRRRMARREPRRLRPGAGGVRAGPVHRLRRLQPVADRADRDPGTPPWPTQSSGCSGGPWARCSATPWTTTRGPTPTGIVRALERTGTPAASARKPPPGPTASWPPPPAPARPPPQTPRRRAVAVHHHPAGQPAEGRRAAGPGRADLPAGPRLPAGPARNRLDPRQHRRHLPPARHDRPAPGRLDEAEDWYRKSLASARNSATAPAWRPPTTSSA